MPVINEKNQDFPNWSEVEYFKIIHLDEDKNFRFLIKSDKQKLFVGKGKCKLKVNGDVFHLNEGECFDIPLRMYNSFEIFSSTKAVLILLGGDWGKDIGNSGIFSLQQSPAPKNTGDPVDYERNTEFDNHFHDMDEYWIIFDGKGKAVTEGKAFEVKAGDCVVTKKGAHHDFPMVYETIRGVYFETTLKGKKRSGHLWNHKHK